MEPGIQTEMVDQGGYKRRGAKADKEPGWIDTDPLQTEDVPDVPDFDPGKPWPRESSLLLGQLMVSLFIIIVGTVLFAGYVIGIASGCICWLVGLAGLVQITRHNKAGLTPCASSGGQSYGKHEAKFHACSQFILYALGALGLLALGVLQSYLSHAVDGGGSCTVRLYPSQGHANTTIMASLNGTSLDMQCTVAKSGALRGYAETVGCGGSCLCVDRHDDPISGSMHTCKHTCYGSSLVSCTPPSCANGCAPV